MNTHFTGQGRDIEQLKATSQLIQNNDSVMFVGCSTGEEIMDFQSICHNNLAFYGIDYDTEIVKQANEKSYKTKPKIFSANIMKDDFLEQINNHTNRKLFDVIICRNLLIYYKDEAVNKIIKTLSEITNRLLILGISDPVGFTINENIAQIEKYKFKVIDFDNRIFEIIK